MELFFEMQNALGSGINPDAIHQSDNSVHFFKVEDGLLKRCVVNPGLGDVAWDTIAFTEFSKICQDKTISRMIMKNIPRKGVYGVWWQDDNPDNDQRHRFAIWSVEDDISDYLDEGTIEHSLDNPISTLSLSLENPSKSLVGETTSLVNPGFEIEIQHAIGDATPIQMGFFYVDKSDMRVTDALTFVDARNKIGKYLKDQTFDSVYSYPSTRLDTLIYDIFEDAGITNTEVYVQGPASFNVGMDFPRNMDYLSGIREVLKTSLNWDLEERADGIIVVGSRVTYSEFPTRSDYEFEKGTEVFSRGITRDDSETYAKVCVHRSDFSALKYEVVDIQDTWVVNPNKTLYVPVPDATPQTEIDAYAADLADRLVYAGTLETFEGPFRPQLLVGDTAKITYGGNTYTLGQIVSIKHQFGKRGTRTEFVVDKSGRKGKPRIKELIEIISSGNTIGSATRTA